MARKQKKEKTYKFLTGDQIEALHKKSDEELLREHLSETKAIKSLARQKKEDPTLSQLKKEIKEHRDKNTPDRVKELREEIKEIKKEVDEEIPEIIEDKKALEKGYNENIAIHRERADAIQKIIDDRPGK